MSSQDSKGNKLSNMRVLVTGACGTVGKELIRQLLKNSEFNPSEVLGIDNNESEIFFLDQDYLDDSRANFFLGDLRDKDTLIKISKGVDIIFHAAALKHVVLCERSPFEAVQTNILGVQNVISAASENEVEKVIFTSSDKAVNPTNVMGTSKLMGERLITAANSSSYSSRAPIFASTRFGNVLGSNGSVIPIFRKQIQDGGPVTLTDEDMTRFVMTVEQSARLVLESASLAKGGEVFITKMPVIKISTLAEAMIEELAEGFGYKAEDIQVEVIGAKPGEKLYEELMSDEETRRSVELDNYFSVLPAFRGMYSDINYNYANLKSDKVTNPYNSAKEKCLSKAELKSFLLDNNLLGSKPEDLKSQRYWPGDKN
ncbi:MAG: polysaccharide biosynthesis protein [Porticoccus sp.]|nr:polysaccharide biosynthesis protein [Porticoccus sp.]